MRRVDGKKITVKVDGHQVPTMDSFMDIVMAQSRRVDRAKWQAAAAAALALVAIVVAVIALLQ